MPERDDYLPIEAYGAIGNLRTVALIGRNGSIDWCCLPELDAPSVFGALLDHRRGGRFRVTALGAAEGAQRYRSGTNVLETVFDAEGGRLVLTDFMPLHGDIRQGGRPPTAPELHRLLHCEAGTVEIEIEWAPRFDYARHPPRMREAAGGWVAEAGGTQLTLTADPGISGEVRSDGFGPVLVARLRLDAGEQLALVCRLGAVTHRYGQAAVREALAHTETAWREWAHTCAEGEVCTFGGPYHALVVRSGLALKLLTHPGTGAIAAAATTSLPEEVGGVRNWDYRFSWIRDAAFTAQALFSLGHRAEALGFLRWCAEVAAARGERDWGLQIMYGLHGERELPEAELPHLEGYRGSRPVRVGNGAATQTQHDIYGELLGAAYEYTRLGGTLEPGLAGFLARVADRACEVWREPDYGIWEVRGGPRHFVYSKLMVWVALDRAVRLAQRYGLKGDLARWRRERSAVRNAILTQGYDAGVGAFVQDFGSTALDAANLLLPVVEFLPFDDPRVQSTIDRTRERLMENGLVYRYLADDGLPGGEGGFLLTTFWMVDALALSGRTGEASELLQELARRASPLGLYAEEVDPRSGGFLGNFPQAFSHVGLINSTLYLARTEGRVAPAPAPIGSRLHAAETGHHSRAAG